MKNFTSTLCTVLLLAMAITVSAQNNSTPKKYLFNNYPAVIDLSEAQLSKLFSGKQDKNSSLAISGIPLDGPVVSNNTKYNSLQTIVIKLAAFNDVPFSITRRKDEENNDVYVGHLFSRDYADGYELKHTNGNAYQLIKIETEKLLPACNLK